MFWSRSRLTWISDRIRNTPAAGFPSSVTLPLMMPEPSRSCPCAIRLVAAIINKEHSVRWAIINRLCYFTSTFRSGGWLATGWVTRKRPEAIRGICRLTYPARHNQLNETLPCVSQISHSRVWFRGTCGRRRDVANDKADNRADGPYTACGELLQGRPTWRAHL